MTKRQQGPQAGAGPTRPYKRTEPHAEAQVAEGVLIHESEFIQSNAVVVHGRAGVLLIDPGITGSEMAALVDDVRELGQPVVAGWSRTGRQSS
jgi:glyoxylase-like metal-dependent hydrolase (beta-lactamase superfamily II)